MKKNLLLAVTLAILPAMAGCGSSSSSSNTATTGTALAGLASCTAQTDSAVICGTALASDGVTPVANATITLTSSATSSLSGLVTTLSGLTADSDACTTDGVGAFACQVDDCTGSATFQIESDSFGNPLEFTATCSVGEVTEVATADTTAGAEQNEGVNWLVIPGSFDGIQLLLSQLKDCTLTGDESSPASLRGSEECEAAGLKVLDTADVATFLTTEDLGDYQAIFANCDADYSSFDGVDDALESYIEGGGNMYFSDLADSWLTSAFPDYITYPSNKNSTTSGTMSDAEVVDENLQVFLGSADAPQETMDIIFDFGVWTAMESVVESWTTYIQGDVDPLSSSLTGTIPMTVGGPVSNGCVFYTSYHVESGGSGADQEDALRYLVLNRVNNCD